MRDNQLFALIIPILNAGFAAQSLDIIVMQNFQPTQQGVPNSPVLYLHKVSDHRYGHVHRKDEWDDEEEVERHTETQWYETTFQASALAIQDPANVNSLTAADILNTAAAILQSDSTIQALGSQNVGILRIMDIRNPYFTDDRDRFEASPSFDFTLTHEQAIITEIPFVITEEFNIARV